MSSNFIRPFLAIEEGISVSVKWPWAFLILIPALVLAIIPFFRLHKSRRYNAKHIIPLIIHILILCMATTLISQIDIIRTTKAPEETKIIILADMSNSNADMKDKMNEYIESVKENADEKTEIGVMVFSSPDSNSKNAAIWTVEFGKEPKKEGDYLDVSFTDKQQTQNTDIASAFKEIVVKFEKEKNCNKRVILLSDGRQTVGNALGAAKTLLANDIRLDAAYFDIIDDENTAEVQMLSITTAVLEGQTKNVAVKLDLQSTMATSGKIVFYEIPQSADGEGVADPIEVHSENVSIRKGKNAISFEYFAEGAGIHTVYAQFVQSENEEKKDAISQNNTIYSWFALDGNPKILIFDGDGTQVNDKNNILDLIGKKYEYEVMSNYNQFPQSMEELLPYDEIILMNIDFSKLPYGSTDLIKRYVEELGRGLVFTCGSNTYNYNDQSYADNPLIDILPVDLKIDERKEVIATIITVDMSSSMGQAVGSGTNEHGGTLTRYDMVKESVLKLIERKYNSTTGEETTEFADEDYIGIVLFDSDASIALPLTQLYERDWIAQQIEYSFESYFYKHSDEKNPSYSNRLTGGTKDANGYSIKSYGTNYKFAIDAANQMLSESDADLKQMVFLSDGEPSDTNSGYDNTIRRMAQAGVVTSTISVGKENSNELQNLATIGHGKFSQVTSVLDLNDSLVQIAETIKGKPINERDTQLEKQNDSPILVGLPKEEYDIIKGYYGTTIKNGAKIVLSADDLRPIIAEWDVGRGHAVVYMSDLGGNWSKSLFNDNDGIANSKIVANLLVSALNDDVGASGLTVSSERKDGSTRITVQTEKRIRDTEELVVYVTDKNGNQKEYRGFDRLADTKYKIEIPTPDAQANYNIRVDLVDKDSGEICDTMEAAVVGFYAKEYDLFGVDGKSAIEDMAFAGGGKTMQNPDDVYDIQRKQFETHPYDLLLPLLIPILCLFVLEIGLRHLPSKKKEKKNVMTEEERFASMRGR